MALGGNWKGELAKLIDAAEAMGRKKVHASLTKQFLAEALAITREEFRTGSSPDSSKWKPTYRGGTPLSGRTGLLKNSVARGTLSDSEFTIVVGQWYGVVHQDGMTIVPKTKPYLRFQINGQWVMKKSVTIPQRKILPDGGDLPPRWAQRFDELFDAMMTRISAGERVWGR